jgi:hypothetical protein
MASDELQALWAQIEADLRRARSFLPPDADSDPVVREYQEFLEHNELELACDMLEQYAEERPMGPAFWLALRDAAAKMSLQERASQYEAQANRGERS